MIPPSTTITEQGRRLRRALLWLGAGVVALNVVVVVASSVAGGGAVSGPGGSSFVTTRSGSAALAGTLDRLGVGVVQSRRPLDEVSLDPGTAVVTVDVGGADYTSSELNALEAHLQAGGRLIVAGQATMVDRLLADPPRWISRGSDSASPAAGLGISGEETVPLSGFGSLDPAGVDQAVVIADDGTVVAVSRPVGEGRFVWIADSFPVHNQGIGVDEAAVTVMALIGPQDRVLFDEYRHGYREEGGLWALLPDRWRLALGLGGLVALMGLVAYGRRLGPPHDLCRRMPPGRELYLEAVAGMLARANAKADALETIRSEVRRRLEERAPRTEPEVATGAGPLDPAEVEAVFGPGSDDDTLVAADRALAALNRENQ